LDVVESGGARNPPWVLGESLSARPRVKGRQECVERTPVARLDELSATFRKEFPETYELRLFLTWGKSRDCNSDFAGQRPNRSGHGR
jgi:hypothetical protein